MQIFTKNEKETREELRAVKGIVNGILLSIPFWIVFFCVAKAFAFDISFEWTANPEPLDGYKLYYKDGTDRNPPYNGTGLTDGTSPITVPKITSFTVTGLDDTKTYTFALTAYTGETAITNESGYSALVTVSPEDTPIITGISINN